MRAPNGAEEVVGDGGIEGEKNQGGMDAGPGIHDGGRIERG